VGSNVVEHGLWDPVKVIEIEVSFLSLNHWPAQCRSLRHASLFALDHGYRHFVHEVVDSLLQQWEDVWRDEEMRLVEVLDDETRAEDQL
jgi:hypothetical protein